MKSLFYTFPKTLGEEFLHLVPRVSVIVSRSMLIAPVCASYRRKIPKTEPGSSGRQALAAFPFVPVLYSCASQLGEHNAPPLSRCSGGATESYRTLFGRSE